MHLPQSSGGAAAGEPTLQGIGRAGSKWSAYEDDVLRRCVQLHGGCWPLILSEFRKAIPGHTRTKDSLVNRKQAVFAPGRTAQRLQSNSQTTGSSSLYHATSVRLSTSSVAAAPRSEAPSPQASDPVAVAEHAWTEGEKACLLQIALDHPDLCVVEQSEHSSQTDEVQRVYDIFRTIFPDTTRPPSSVHAKCCELLQRQQEAAEHRAGEEPMGEAPVGTQERYGGESVGQGDSYRSSASEGHSAPNEVAAVTSGQQADQEEPAAPSQPGEGEDNEMSGLHNTATGLASLAQQRDIPPTASPPSTNIAHAQPSGVTQLKTGVHDLECGFRFDYMLANLTICIHSAGYWEPIQPALQQLAPGSPQERAIFVFSILQDGSLLTLRTPPGTRSHAVCVDENGNEVDRQSRMSGQVKVAGIEHRFCSPDSLTVIFFEPL